MRVPARRCVPLDVVVVVVGHRVREPRRVAEQRLEVSFREETKLAEYMNSALRMYTP